MINDIYIYDLGDIPSDILYNYNYRNYSYSELLNIMLVSGHENVKEVFKELCHFGTDETKSDYIISSLSGFGFELNKSEINSRYLTFDYSMSHPPKKLSIEAYVKPPHSMVEERRKTFISNTKTKSKVLIYIKTYPKNELDTGYYVADQWGTPKAVECPCFYILGYIEETTCDLHSEQTTVKLSIACDTPYFMLANSTIESYIWSIDFFKKNRDAVPYGFILQVYAEICRQYNYINDPASDTDGRIRKFEIFDYYAFPESSNLPMIMDEDRIIFSTATKYYTL